MISHRQQLPRRLEGACCSVPDQVWYTIGTRSVGQSGLSDVPRSVPKFLGQFVKYIPLIGISRPVAKLLSQFVNYILEYY